MAGSTDYQYALKHRYRLEHDGPFVPGVTTVIGVLDKPGLKWGASGVAAKVAIENGRRKKTVVKAYREKLLSARGKGESVRAKHELGTNGTDNEVFAHWCRGQFDVQWREKANRGSRVHDLAERLTRGEDVDARTDEIGYVKAWMKFQEDYAPTFHYVESIIGGHTVGANAPESLFELPYGGRFDFIAELHGPGGEGLFLNDYKTGSSWESELALQMIGYMKGELIEFNEAGAISGLTPLPELDGARGIYLRDDGTYSIVDPFAKIDESDAWRAFSACNTIHATMKSIDDALGKEHDD